MEAKIPIPKSWNKRVQAAILQAISLGRHCFVSIVGRMANSPNAIDRIVAENEHLKHEVESLRVELRFKDARMARLPSPRPCAHAWARSRSHRSCVALAFIWAQRRWDE